MLLDLFSGKNLQPAECVIRIGGEEIVHLYPYLIEVGVTMTRRDGTEATLQFQTRRDRDGQWLVQDDPLIEPWAEIEIIARFGEDDQEVMRGYLKKVSASYPTDAGTSTVIISCQDASILMDRNHRRRVWGAETPTDDLLILSEMLGDVGLALDPESTGESGVTLNQNQTDIRFLRTRSQELGYDLIFREGLLYFGPWRLDDSPQETIIVQGGPDTQCISFSLDEDGHTPDQVTFDVASESGSDAVEQSVTPNQTLLGPEAAGSESSGLADFNWRLNQQGEANPDRLQRIAQTKANENAFKIKASGELDGSLYGYVLHVGKTVGVDGVGERHSGIYYVDRVEHKFDGNGYRQSFQLLRNAYGDNLAENLPGVLSAL
ncbi:phage late control D family protein [Haloferula chungangensis]|uniref:Phage late control D family protein n=1 Tax=Haloferula chungangensis TaxID=1048331 RepID=A0ABW2L0H2_9BACT